MSISNCELFNKHEEAIKHCKLDYELFPDDNKHLLIAIEALEKQIAFKPEDIGEAYTGEKIGFCECGNGLLENERYCSNCGQKIDWE